MGNAVKKQVAMTRVTAAAAKNDVPELRAALEAHEPSPGQLNAALFIATNENAIDAVRVLIEHSPNLDVELDGVTPLMMAGALGNVDMTRALLDGGADVNFVTAGGHTALVHAVYQNHVELCELFISRGADVNAKITSEEMTCLMVASMKGNSGVIGILVKAGAQVDTKCLVGETALMRAATEDQVGAVLTLLDLRAQVDAEYPNKRTAMMAAANRGGLAMVQCLLDRGAQINFQDGEGKTALHLATANGHVDVVKLLLERQAELERVDMNDDTAAALADAHGRSDILQVLLDAGAVARKSKVKPTAFKSAVTSIASTTRSIFGGLYTKGKAT